MKKTLVAAGIAAVVAAPAFADVKVSGQVLQTFTMVENADMVSARDNAISFSASEDLGNGLTAFATLAIDLDKDSDAASGSTKDEIVGLKGGFGTFVTGRMEDFSEGKIHSKMTLMTTSANASNSATGALVEGMLPSPASRTDGAIAYVSPTVNGFHVGVATYNDEANDIAVFYDNGPISLAASYETQKPSLVAGTVDQETLSMAASYTMGDLKATVVHVQQDNTAGTAANDIDGTGYRVDYKLGANTITFAHAEGETGAGAKNGSASALEVVHNFSKQTSIGAAWSKRDNESTADVDYLSFGMKHKF
jgi:predicted porin